MRKIEKVIIEEFAHYYDVQKDKEYTQLYNDMLVHENKIIELIGKANMSLLNKFEIASDMVTCRREELLVSFVLNFVRQFFNKKRKW